ncbi:CBS domain-containing protein [Streptomyces sp. RO-S4]|uniref:CBS domain-containing protein n=1 Tax=Streptomyces sp. RO-S4 TaxID=2902486 RepID=UPI00208F501E|nr:CBS domain-containing protein [Streptomyces sp. RO-S4]MCO4696048.1 CBS domain-containing protein [Streptomyces sp. RO-S4]
MKATEVGAVMTTDVVTAAYGTPLGDVVRRLGEHRVGGLPVTDDEDRVVGVICASDLTRLRTHGTVTGSWRRGTVRRLLRALAGGRARTAGGAMSAPAVTVGARATVTEASCLMTAHGVERLPVVDDEERLVGIVTRRDLHRALLRTDRDIDRAVRRYVLGTALWLTPRALAVGVEDGVVTLTGQVERRSDVELAVDAASRIDGVVAVVDQLSFRVDDTRLPAGTALAQGGTGETAGGR